MVDEMKAVKNEVELEGMRRAYLRDGAAYVRILFNETFGIPVWSALCIVCSLGQVACLARTQGSSRIRYHGVRGCVALDRIQKTKQTLLGSSL